MLSEYLISTEYKKIDIEGLVSFADRGVVTEKAKVVEKLLLS